MHFCASTGRLYHTNSKGPHQNIALHRHSSPSGLKPPQNKLVTSVLESLLSILPILLFVRIQHPIIKKQGFLLRQQSILQTEWGQSHPLSPAGYLSRVWSRSRSILSFLFYSIESWVWDNYSAQLQHKNCCTGMVTHTLTIWHGKNSICKGLTVYTALTRHSLSLVLCTNTHNGGPTLRLSPLQ